MLDRAKSWSLGLGYYLSTTASVNDGSNNDKWKGTALKADIGYSISIADKLYTGIRLNYSSASYSENFIGGTGYTEVSYSKTAVYPSVSTSYFF